MDVEATQQAAGAARVLGGDERDRRQRLARPLREIVEVPDRRADEVEDAAHGAMVPRSPRPTMVSMAQAHKDYSRHPAPEEARDPRGQSRVYVAGAPEGFDAVLGPLPTGVQRLGRAGVGDGRRPAVRDPRSETCGRGSRSSPPALEPAGRLWVAWPKKASASPERPRLRHGAADRPRRGARGQQERVDHRRVPGTAVRLPPQGPPPLRAARRSFSRYAGASGPSRRVTIPATAEPSRGWRSSPSRRSRPSSGCGACRARRRSCSTRTTTRRRPASSSAAPTRSARSSRRTSALFREQEWDVGSFVHPPLGKWTIALGIKAFGMDPFGWRIGSASAGTLAVTGVALIAQLLFGRPLWTFVGGTAARPGTSERRALPAGVAGHPPPALDRRRLPVSWCSIGDGSTGARPWAARRPRRRRGRRRGRRALSPVASLAIRGRGRVRSGRCRSSGRAGFGILAAIVISLDVGDVAAPSRGRDSRPSIRDERSCRRASPSSSRS